jgi:SpoVK/Ycf46/Vps4 family AAA+-type ATPase
LSERQANVLVLGATNRVRDLDEAVLRRFNLKFPVCSDDGPALSLPEWKEADTALQ